MISDVSKDPLGALSQVRLQLDAHHRTGFSSKDRQQGSVIPSPCPDLADAVPGSDLKMLHMVATIVGWEAELIDDPSSACLTVTASSR